MLASPSFRQACAPVGAGAGYANNTCAPASPALTLVPLPEPTIIGEAPAHREALRRALQMAPYQTNVLVTGESGTGKELYAHLLHEHGPNPRGPFVAVNCGALSRELAESELFGHERGAFTGAAGRHAGWFEEASGGTLVLDEIGELPLELQPKLLRVLETGRLRRVGGRGEVAVSVRVVALTLRDLGAAAANGHFRLDLYHRLCGFELHLPALRERREDIPALALHFLAAAAAELGRPRRFAPEALARLSAHGWPGNVRQLRNVVRRAAFLSGELVAADAIDLGTAPASRAADAPSGAEIAPPAGPQAAAEAHEDTLALRGRSFEELERHIYIWALRRSGGSRRRAAQALGISRSTFCDRVRRLGLP